MANLNVSGELEAGSLGGGVSQLIIDLIYPVGSYFITESSDYNTVTKVQAHFGGTWVSLGDNRFLEAVSTGAGTNKSAGLPNITGVCKTDFSSTFKGAIDESTGAFSLSSISKEAPTAVKSQGFGNLNFDASRSNSIYGASSTVQPKSRTVYMYRRTA